LAESQIKERKTFTDHARVWLKGVLDPVGRFLNRLGITPNMMTMVGLIGHIAAAYFLTRGEVTTGGLIVFFLAPVDALDGTMARLRGEPSNWGGFVDSVVDRYSEVFVFGGLSLYYAQNGEWIPVGLCYLAATGSLMVSYVRARAQSLGLDVKVGFFTRLERYLVLVPILVFNIVVPGLVILAIGTYITSLQRIFSFRAQAREPQGADGAIEV
jgi:CDP-diacylglycerol--glycerol-3-phosphate 3-phosphatidyltransferase